MYVLSGRDGLELAVYPGLTVGEDFGRSLARVDDLDRDGRAELLVGGPGVGAATLYSLGRAEILRRWVAPDWTWLGFAVAAADLDGDGLQDSILGARTGQGQHGNGVVVYSGATGGLLLEIRGLSNGVLVPDISLAAGADFDGDGLSDFVVGTPDELGTYPPGAVRAFHVGCLSSAPVAYCQAGTNSTGGPATLTWSGTTSIRANDFALGASGNPPSALGRFFMGRFPAEEPFGDGWLCVAGQVVQYPMQRADAAGAARMAIDNRRPPALGRLLPSTSWYFQWWYRDPLSTGFGFNLSAGLATTFCP